MAGVRRFVLVVAAGCGGAFSRVGRECAGPHVLAGGDARDQERQIVFPLGPRRGRPFIARLGGGHRFDCGGVEPVASARLCRIGAPVDVRGRHAGPSWFGERHPLRRRLGGTRPRRLGWWRMARWGRVCGLHPTSRSPSHRETAAPVSQHRIDRSHARCR